MTRTSISGRTPDRGAASAKGESVAAHDPLELIVDHAVGIVRESAGLVGNVAGLGLGLFFKAKKAAPPRYAAPKPTNVIPFPTTRSSNRLK